MKAEIIINKAFASDKVALASIRNKGGKTMRFIGDSKLLSLIRGDGAVVEFTEALAKGNYMDVRDFKVLDIHHSGKRLTAEEALAEVEKATEARMAQYADAPFDV